MTHTQLTTENAAAAVMPTGLAYAARCNWIAKRDALVRGATSAAPIVASADDLVLLELEAAAGCNYFDNLDRAADAPRPIFIHSVSEALFAVACIKRRKQSRRAA